MLGKYLAHFQSHYENQSNFRTLRMCAENNQKKLNNIYQAVYSRAVSSISFKCTIYVFRRKNKYSICSISTCIDEDVVY